jgi:DeoR/GlpR family transcriptional regulator of sugar metabolism
LNPRQVQVVGRLLEQTEITVEDFEALCPGVNRRTLQRDLQGLAERGVAKPLGAARAARYRLRIKGS